MRQSRRPTIRQTSPDMPSGSGSGGTATVCLDWIVLGTRGSVTGGSYTIDVTATDDDDNTTTETLTINHDDTAADVQTEFETHAEITSADFGRTFGKLPQHIGFAIKTVRQINIVLNTNSLTGTNAEPDIIPVINSRA